MSKILHAIEMLNYLNTGNKYSVKELSNKLEISERMVRYYKNELEQAGIPIETFMGPNGGYYIINTGRQFNHFNKYDLQILENVEVLLKRNNYENLLKYQKIVDKIRFSSDIEEEKSKYFFDKCYISETELYFNLNDAIINKKQLTILYKNLNGSWQERIIHPLQFFNYENKLYITAYCELRDDIRHFEVDRIKINN